MQYQLSQTPNVKVIINIMTKKKKKSSFTNNYPTSIPNCCDHHYILFSSRFMYSDNFCFGFSFYILPLHRQSIKNRKMPFTNCICSRQQSVTMTTRTLNTVPSITFINRLLIKLCLMFCWLVIIVTDRI